jgi:hypothetical protein
VDSFKENPHDDYVYKIRNVTQNKFYLTTFVTLEKAEHFIRDVRKFTTLWDKDDELDIHQFIIVDKGACRVDVLHWEEL